MSKLWANLQIGLGIVGAVIVAIGIAFLRGRSAGITHIEAEQQKRRDHLQDHYDDIDRQAIDPAGSYYRLRGLSDDKDRR
jgi:hypothetical protein